MKDLQVGRQVPPQELAKLMPLPEMLAEPATIEQATEQGAADSAMYFAQLSQIAFLDRSNELIELISWEHCRNCDDVSQSIDDRDPETEYYWEKPTYLLETVEKLPDAYPLYKVCVGMRWSSIVVVNSPTQTIEEVNHETSNTRCYATTFFDGRWRPLYLNITESQTDEN